jgi:predicted ferric reductase
MGLVWGVVLFVLPLPLIQTLAAGLPSIYASEALAVQVGSIAYVWFLAAIYLATRPHWLDRLIGLPSIYMVHGMLSLLAILLAYLHKSGTSSAGWIKTTGDWAFDLFLFLMVYSLVFMAGWLTSRVPPLAALKRWLEKLFKHELSVWLHRLNLVAVALVFIHVQLISYITAIHPFMWCFDGYTAVVAALYLWAKWQNWQVPSGKLIAKRELAPNFYEFTVRLPRRYRNNIAPGDYIFIKFPDIAGLKELHPFSVVNQVTAGEVVLAIRGDGDFTRAIQQLAVGARVGLTSGYGRFASLVQEHPDARLVLIAGGSGMVPMVALAQAYGDRPVTMYYAAHRQQDLIYLPELKELAAQHPQLAVHAQAGRFDVTQVAAAEADADTIYLLSGPSTLGRAWQRALRQAGVTEAQMYYEEFSW